MRRLLAVIAILAGLPRVADPRLPGGTIIVHGGGSLSDAVWRRFVAASGGPGASYVFIPTADDDYDPKYPAETQFPFDRLQRTRVLTTHCRTEADNADFAAAIDSADAVWFGNGRPWRLIATYRGTQVERALRRLLDRGGVVGGSGGGAIALASFLVRGDILKPNVMVSPGNTAGFALLDRIAIDDRIELRNRVVDLAPVVAAHPRLLGIGLESGAALLVHDGMGEVLGSGRVAITDNATHTGKPYYFVASGGRIPLPGR